MEETEEQHLLSLRGRVAISSGAGPGLNNHDLGDKSGTQTNTLGQLNLPPHNHTANGTIYASMENGSTNDPSSAIPAKSVYPKDRSTNEAVNSYAQKANTKMAANGIEISVNNTGGGQPVNNMQPYLAINWIICVNGIYPSRG
ncbi:hypothetical protein SAMN05660903_03778 [Salegentibacter salinarum]|nr:phage tail protein [Salegentibacter salinarum]SKC01023.1 hypothetical protein SAMN05660903_03778 [Salegentibacter salinarum]